MRRAEWGAALADGLGGEATKVAVFVAPGSSESEAGRGERRAQPLVLVPAQLDQEPSVGSEQTGGRNHDPAQHIETVAAPI